MVLDHFVVVACGVGYFVGVGQGEFEREQIFGAQKQRYRRVQWRKHHEKSCDSHEYTTVE